MLSGWLITLISIAYLGLLFAIAYYGDIKNASKKLPISPAVIYSLSLAVYCSSWTFYGAVGRASTNGWAFIATYIAPIIVFIFGWQLIEKIAIVSKQQNITTISDFISSRYGKSQSLAVVVTIIAVMGAIPYISLQLKAVAMSYNALTSTSENITAQSHDTAFFVAIIMAIFSILFGTRNLDATEHHKGLVLAISFEALIKLTAFIAAGIFVTFALFGSIEEMASSIYNHIIENEQYNSIINSSFLTEILLAGAAIICLPRQFHVAFVENNQIEHLRLSRWLFPAYMLLMSLFILPISIAGSELFNDNSVDADTYVLMLPLIKGQEYLAVLAFIGGLSAATGMVIVSSITLSTMVCNDIIMPLLLRIPKFNSPNNNPGAMLLPLRRISILLIILIAYFYYLALGDKASLASLGLLAIATTIQFLPAIIGGIYWKRGSKHGTLAGLISGFLLWIYTLAIPSLKQSGVTLPSYINNLFNSDWYNPTALFGITGFDILTHGVMWSLGINIFLYILVSFYSKYSLIDRIQADAFISNHQQQPSKSLLQDNLITSSDLQLLVERFLGSSRAQREFDNFIKQHDSPLLLPTEKASPELIRFTERLLSGAIGASSARIVLKSTLQGTQMQLGDVVTIVDEASKAIHFSRSLLQSTIENTSLGISVVDQHNYLVAWNRAYIDMFSYPDELICVGRHIEEIFYYNAMHGEYGSGDPITLAKSRLAELKKGESRHYERSRPNGTVLEVKGNPMPNGGYVNTYSDITEHKRIEAALRKSEQNIRIYTDNVPVLIAYLDTECRFQFMNKAYADAFKLDRTTALKQYGYHLLPHEVYQLRTPYIEGVLKGNRQRFETTLIINNNQKRHMEVTYIPYNDEHNNMLGYFTLYQDITDRRNAEKALQETNETLETRVTERTSALSIANKDLRKENTIRSLIEDELRQAKSDADAANQGKTRFLAAASHDLLQPLNAARLFASALAQQSHNPEVKQLVKNLSGSLTSAEELITTILDISKLDSGALEPKLTDFYIEDIFALLSSEFKALANKKELEFHFIPCNSVVYSDPKLLRRIIQNFLSNAIRYTDKGRVLLGCRRREQRIIIEVWDTGAGIADDQIEEIFEEFRRIDNPKHSEVKGLGLGLAITERIATMLNHPIDVRSWPTQGSVFSVSVPLGNKTVVKKTQPEKTGWTNSKGLAGIKVLVIDNEPKILEGMTALLQGWGCHTATAISDDKAIAKIKEQKYIPDLILIDYHLSATKTGIMALEQLQPLLKSHTPAIFITADRTEEIKIEIQQSGAFLLTKPIRPAALRAIINKAITQKNS